MAEAMVIRVDSFDVDCGLVERVKAHTGKGMLHRAVSVLLGRGTPDGMELLLQKRSKEKQLWPETWANTVCTHPERGERYAVAASRRLREEMGITILPERFISGYRFEYQAQYTPSLAEHELDTVLFCVWEGHVHPNEHEVAEWQWRPARDVVEEIRTSPDRFAPWFRLIMDNPSTKMFCHIV